MSNRYLGRQAGLTLMQVMSLLAVVGIVAAVLLTYYR
jgi:Tfp pilus assembly major pilin PilA